MHRMRLDHEQAVNLLFALALAESIRLPVVGAVLRDSRPHNACRYVFFPPEGHDRETAKPTRAAKNLRRPKYAR
jgi:hypothetical protein